MNFTSCKELLVTLYLHWTIKRHLGCSNWEWFDFYCALFYYIQYFFDNYVFMILYIDSLYNILFELYYLYNYFINLYLKTFILTTLI